MSPSSKFSRRAKASVGYASSSDDDDDSGIEIVKRPSSSIAKSKSKYSRDSDCIENLPNGTRRKVSRHRKAPRRKAPKLSRKSKKKSNQLLSRRADYDSESSGSSGHDSVDKDIFEFNSQEHAPQKISKVATTIQTKTTVARSSEKQDSVSFSMKNSNFEVNGSGAALASSKATRAIISDELTSPSQLKWHRKRISHADGARTNIQLRPCRIMTKDEVLRYQRKKGLNSSVEERAGRELVQFFEFPNIKNGKCLFVDESSLIPFGDDDFNDDCLNRYMQQQRMESSEVDPINLEAEKQYLKRVYDHAKKLEKQLRKQASKEFRDFCGDDSDSDESVNEMELDIPYTQAISLDPDNDTIPEKSISNEPIRPGDVIEYYSPIYVAGDPRGRRQATVLSIHPKREVPLVLSNAECIPDDVKVKRVKVLVDNELVEHPGIYRSIARFRLASGKLDGYGSAAAGAMMEAERFCGIMEENAEKLKSKAEAEGFAPMDLLNIPRTKRQLTKVSSSPPSIKKSAGKGKERSLSLSSSSDCSDDGARHCQSIQAARESRFDAKQPLENDLESIHSKEHTEHSHSLSHTKEPEVPTRPRSDSLQTFATSASESSDDQSEANHSEVNDSLDAGSTEEKNISTPFKMNKASARPRSGTSESLSSSSSDSSVNSTPAKPKAKESAGKERSGPNPLRSSNLEIDLSLSSSESVSSEISNRKEKSSRKQNIPSKKSDNSGCSMISSISRGNKPENKQTTSRNKYATNASFKQNTSGKKKDNYSFDFDDQEASTSCWLGKENQNTGSTFLKALSQKKRYSSSSSSSSSSDSETSNIGRPTKARATSDVSARRQNSIATSKSNSSSNSVVVLDDFEPHDINTKNSSHPVKRRKRFGASTSSKESMTELLSSECSDDSDDEISSPIGKFSSKKWDRKRVSSTKEDLGSSGGWIQGEGGWVRSQSDSLFSLSISRHK